MKELKVYSKTRNKIDLKFLRPYPPTGELVGYYLKYNHKYDTRRFTATKSVTPCTIWPNYDCIKVTDLKSYTQYYLEVSSVNYYILFTSRIYSK